MNVRLASKLTGYSLSLVKEGAEDIELVEFKSDLGAELYDALITAGIDTAREFLEAEPRDLLNIIDQERVIELRTLILEEFEEREDPHYLAALEAAENGEEPPAPAPEAAEGEEAVAQDEAGTDTVEE